MKLSASRAPPPGVREGGSTDSPSYARGLIWSLVAAFFAAGFLIPYRFAVEEAPRLPAMTAMFVVAAIFNTFVGLVPTRRTRWSVDRVAFTTAVVLALATVFGNLGIARALPTVGAGMTSVLLKSQVILTPILAIWFLKERASSRLWIGAGIAFFGVAFPQLFLAEQNWDGTGYAAALFASVAFSVMQLVTRRVIARIDPPVVNALRLAMAVGLVQLLPEGRMVWGLSTKVWFYAGAAGILGAGLSRLCLMAALRHISPSLVALVALVGPLFAFGLEYGFFGELPTRFELLGAGLVLVGVLFPLLPVRPRFRKRPGDTSKLGLPGNERLIGTERRP